MFGLADSCDGTGIAVVHADVLEGRTLLSLNEVDEWRHVEIAVEPDAGSGVPQPDELLRVRVAQGFEQNAVDHPEDHGVGANADYERDQRNSAEDRSAEEAPESMLQVVERKSHGVS